MKYTKNNVMKKRNQLSSEQIRKHSKISLFLFKYLLVISIALIAAFLGLSVGGVWTDGIRCFPRGGSWSDGGSYP